MEGVGWTVMVAQLGTGNDYVYQEGGDQAATI